MKMMGVLLVADIFLIVSGLAWLIFAPGLSLTAFHHTVSSGFIGLLVCLFGIYQGLRWYRLYKRLYAAGRRMETGREKA